MEWKNLKEKKCPKCFSDLKETFLFQCISCNFKISKGKLYELVGKPIDLEREANKLLKIKTKYKKQWLYGK